MKSKQLKTLIQSVALIIFIVQMVVAFMKYSNEPTMSSPGTETLATLEKPILIAVCPSNQFHGLNASILGYEWSTNYFLGKSRKTDIWTWSGISGNRTVIETINHIYKSDLENVQFSFMNTTTTNRFLLPHGHCKVVEDLPKKVLKVDFTSNGELTGQPSKYSIFLGDPTASPKFALPYFLMTGQNIELEIDPHGAKYTDYNIKLKKTKFLTKDGSCTEYPTDHYENYADCIEDENEKKILPELGCMVPWMSGKNQCEGHITRLPEQEKLSQWLFELIDATWAGFQYESASCPLPCTFLSIHAKYQQTIIRKNSPSPKNHVYLYFEKKVQVETIVIAYDFGDLLVEIGSSLGLWLGLSVVGIFDVIVEVVNIINTLMINLVFKIMYKQ